MALFIVDMNEVGEMKVLPPEQATELIVDLVLAHIVISMLTGSARDERPSADDFLVGAVDTFFEMAKLN